MKPANTYVRVSGRRPLARRLLSMHRRRTWPGPKYFTRNARRRDLGLLTSHLCAIVRRNAPLAIGLAHATVDAPSVKLAQVMITLGDDLATGMRLADAMALMPRFFPAWYVDLVGAGESTGTLERSLSAAGEQIAAAQRFSGNVNGWLAYFGFVLTVQAAIGVFLAKYIVPEFAAMFKDFGIVLPPATRALANVTPLFTPAHMNVVVLVCSCLIALKLVRRLAGEENTRPNRLLAPLPVVGTLSRKADLVSVCAVLERLAAANVPIDDALRDCAALDVAGALRRALLRALARVEQGRSLGDALRPERAFPHSFVTMLALGEASGRLEGAARHLRTMYEQQVLTRLRFAIDIAGPAGVLGLGALTFVIYAGILGAVVQITYALVDTL